MSIETIGKQIASLRKEKGARQEELAKYVGVSAQAVSKWENGGVPDIELLPKIADFFSVSIDSLFNRNISDSNLQSALMKKIIETPNDQQIKAAFDLCWDIERALMPHSEYTDDNNLEDYEKAIGRNEQRYSSMMRNDGFTLIRTSFAVHNSITVRCGSPGRIEEIFINCLASIAPVHSELY